MDRDGRAVLICRFETRTLDFLEYLLIGSFRDSVDDNDVVRIAIGIHV